MSEGIRTKQLMFSVSAFITASSILTKNLYAFTVQDSWMAIILAVITSLIIVAVYAALANRFPGCSLIEINDAAFGPILGKAVSAMYIFYFLSLLYFNTLDLSSFIKEIILPNTPVIMTIVMFVFICAWAVRTGAESMTRYGALLTFIVTGTILLNGFLLLKYVNIRNFLPMFTKPIKNYLIGTHIMTMLPLSEILCFIMLFPYMKQKKDAGKALSGGLLIGAAVLFLIVVRDISVMGNVIQIASRPTFMVARLVDVGEVLPRLEIISAFILIALLFLMVSIPRFSAVSAIARVLKLESYTYLIVIIGVLTVIYSMSIFDAAYEHAIWNMTAAATYSTFFIVLLPVVTLLTAVIRKASRTETSL